MDQGPAIDRRRFVTLGLTGATDASSPAPKKRPAPAAAAKKLPWPKTLAERAKSVGAALAQAEQPLTAAQLAQQFSRAKAAEIQEILETLAALGQAHESDTKGAYVR